MSSTASMVFAGFLLDFLSFFVNLDTIALATFLYVFLAFFKISLNFNPLPRKNEIDRQIDNDKRCVYFDQMRNGVYIRKALLLKSFRICF